MEEAPERHGTSAPATRPSSNHDLLADEKLRLEIAELNRRWFMKPGNLQGCAVVLSVFVAVGTLGSVIYTGTFEAQKLRNEAARDRLAAEVLEFRDTKRVLNESNDRLRSENSKLEEFNTRYRAEKEKIFGDLRVLERRAAVAEIQVELKTLQYHSRPPRPFAYNASTGQTPSLPQEGVVEGERQRAIENVRRLVRKADSHRGERINAVRAEIQQSSTPESMRKALSDLIGAFQK